MESSKVRQDSFKELSSLPLFEQSKISEVSSLPHGHPASVPADSEYFQPHCPVLSGLHNQNPIGLSGSAPVWPRG
jgi:hypothetical protein